VTCENAIIMLGPDVSELPAANLNSYVYSLSCPGDRQWLQRRALVPSRDSTR
jgi:hypothetical protein